MLNEKREKDERHLVHDDERAFCNATEIPSVPFVRAAKQGWRDTLDSSAMKQGMGVGIMRGTSNEEHVRIGAAQDNVTQSYGANSLKLAWSAGKLASRNLWRLLTRQWARRKLDRNRPPLMHNTHKAFLYFLKLLG